MRTLLLIATLLACGRLMQAQATGWPNTRQGFWIGFGVGGGSARVHGTPCYCFSGPGSGASGYVRVGGTLSPHVLLGGETNFWLRDHLGLHFVDAASLVAMWYPSWTAGAYLKMGVGGIRYTYDPQNAHVTDLTATAPSASLGVGYELRASRGVSLVPWAQALASPPVPLHYSPGFTNPPQDVSMKVVLAGVGLTWH